MAVIEPEEFGVSNSILLDDISEKSFIANLKYRFARGRVSQWEMMIVSLSYIDYSPSLRDYCPSLSRSLHSFLFLPPHDSSITHPTLTFLCTHNITLSAHRSTPTLVKWWCRSTLTDNWTSTVMTTCLTTEQKNLLRGLLTFMPSPTQLFMIWDSCTTIPVLSLEVSAQHVVVTMSWF